MIPILRRIQLFLRRDRASAELEEEMRLHQTLRAEAIRVRGHSPADTLAQRRFGNALALQQESRDMWGFGRVDELRQDVRYAIRRLRQRPAFTASVIVVLMLGIGTTTAMFSAIDAAMLRPLPFAHADQLVTVRDVEIPFDPGPGQPAFPASHMISIVDLAAMPDFATVAAYAAGGLNLSDPERPSRLKVGVVTPSFFRALGVGAQLGRTFADGEGKPGGPDVVMLSDAFWRRQYGARDMLNQVIRLNGKPFTVVGVAPPHFSFPDQSDLWIPMTVPVTFATFEPFRGFLSETVIARVAPGVPIARANLRLITAWQQALRAEADSFRHGNMAEMLTEVHDKGAVTPLQQELVGTQRSALMILLGATLCLLLIACANATNLLLAEGAVRRREIALRAVLGATRARVLRQLLTESVILALMGTIAGTAVAPLLLRAMSAMLPAHLIGVAPAHIDLRVLGFAATLSLVTGIGFGLWPAVGASRVSPGETIKAGASSGNTAAAGGRVRRTLVGVEIALTVTLLIGAGLLLRSFERLMDVDRGIDTAHAGSVELAFKVSADGGAASVGTMHRVIAQMEAIPGVQSAGIVNDLPLARSGGMSLQVEVPGMPPPRNDDDFRYARNLVASSGYFTAVGARFVAGRNFVAAEETSTSTAAIINQTVARKYWPGVNPVGRSFRFSGQPVVVTGVIADIRERQLSDSADQQIYRPIEVGVPRNIAVVVRSTLPSRALLTAMANAVRAVDPSQATYHLRMMDDVVSESVAPRRTNTVLITLFGMVALALASFGVFAVVSYGVSQRSREFGIRTALGATGGSLVRLVAREMLLVVAIGAVVGTIAAWMLSRIVASMLYGVTTHDPTAFLVMPFVLMTPVAIATMAPARRAMRVNPAEVMREE